MRLGVICAAFLIACGSKSGGGVDAPGGPGDDAPVLADGATPTVALTLFGRPTTAANFAFVVAYQDGNGPWTLAPPPTGDTYELPIASARYGYMWSCAAGNARVVNLGYFTVAEHTAITDTVPNRCTDAVAKVAITGTIANRPLTGRLVAMFGSTTAIVNPSTGAFRLDTAPDTQDLVIAHVGAGVAVTMDTVVDQVVVSRGLVASASLTKDVDFATAAPVQSFVATIAATGQQRATATTTLFARGGTVVPLVRDGTAPLEVEGLASAQVDPADIYETTLTLAAQGQAATTTLVTASPAAETFVAPPPLGGALASASGGQITTTWQPYANATGYRWEGAQTLSPAQCGANATAPCTVGWVAQLSAGYAGTATMFATPDLPMLATEFHFVAGTPVTGTAQAITTSRGAADFPVLTPAPAGTTRTNVRADWSVTPM